MAFSFFIGLLLQTLVVCFPFMLSFNSYLTHTGTIVVDPD
jgi:hypothetical protein